MMHDTSPQLSSGMMSKLYASEGPCRTHLDQFSCISMRNICECALYCVQLRGV